ncbi:hypothetical protein ES332_D06G064500v1 [Gossypium tomentosum]|uniref:Uncharacterized protein n=1 Tax=Gossypium tomentosum TaxID=34277 RepID=A0A5D2KG42_GOSTO|nr:hypothetical protein ES332_D06G064500v1 [Gossypium tomentosum]
MDERPSDGATMATSGGLTRVEGQRRKCQRRALKVPGGWGWQTRRLPEACGS